MNLLDNWFSREFCVLAFGLLLLIGCSKTTKVEPEGNLQMEYALRDLRYYVSDVGGPDTVTLTLQDTTVLNLTNGLVAHHVASKLSTLFKTSYFEVTNWAELPEIVNFEQFQVHLPSNFFLDSSMSYTPFKVPFATKQAEYPYNMGSSDTLIVNVPARSSILVKTSIQAQNIVCSFTATLDEKPTGRSYPVKGVWKGLLRYDKLSTVLTELPLQGR